MVEPTWIIIPAGRFTMGSDPRDAAPPFANEQPQQRIELPSFRISRVPITNALYHRFTEATSHVAPGNWQGRQPVAGSEDLPVTYITWHDALSFCEWAGVCLPTEAEWEKAARGPTTSAGKLDSETRWWPWGNALPDSTYGHFNGQAQGIPPAAQSVMPVGQFPNGASPYGVLDMAGNVWEWTHSLYHSYPYHASDGREESAATGLRVVRGGSFNHNLRHIRCSVRDGMAPGARDLYIGFRVATGTENASRAQLDWVFIPGGPFWMGNNASSRHSAVLPSEMPQHQLDLASFQIAQTPVTNEEYREFVLATDHIVPSHWISGDVPRGLERHPVAHVDWRDAQAYCAWAGVRLPTEAEWERAAAGSASDAPPRIYPWGDESPTMNRLNFGRDGKRAVTTPVDRYPRGSTPEGILDMAGNVWEWVSTRYAQYPYEHGDGREDIHTFGQRVLRGGSFLSPSSAYVRCAMRSLSYETRRREHIGFRVAQDYQASPEPAT